MFLITLLSSLTQDLTEKPRLLLMKTVPAIVYTIPDGTRFIYQKQYNKAKQSLTPEQEIEVWSKIPDNIRTKIHIMIWNIYFTLLAMEAVIILTIQQKVLNREYGENNDLKILLIQLVIMLQNMMNLQSCFLKEPNC